MQAAPGRGNVALRPKNGNVGPRAFEAATAFGAGSVARPAAADERHVHPSHLGRWILERPAFGRLRGVEGDAGLVVDEVAALLTAGAAPRQCARRIVATTSVTTVSGSTKPSMTAEKAPSASCCCAASTR